MKRWIVFCFIVVSNFTWASRAPSNDPCPSQVHRSGLNDMVQFASINVEEDGMPDPRQTYEEHAEKYVGPHGERLTVDEVYDKFSASGKLYCPTPNNGWSSSSSEVVDKPNVTLLTAHTLYDKKCNSVTGSDDFSSCKFITNVKPPERPKQYKVKSVKVGSKCPYQDKDKKDWAVITLEIPVQNVRPYKLSANCGVKLGWSGLSVSGGSDNFRDGKKFSVLPSCTMKDPDPDASNGSLRALCASGHGNSGGAVLCDSGRATPSIAGIVTSGQEDPYWDRKKYNSLSNFTTVIPITDEIKDAIQAAGS